MQLGKGSMKDWLGGRSKLELSTIQEQEMSQSSSMRMEVDPAPDPAKEQRITEAKAKERMWQTRMMCRVWQDKSVLGSARRQW